MPDNFGDQQNRVLNVLHRNLDNVVFQYRKPPLSSEWNLINQISNEKIQEIAKSTYPSGWVSVGDIVQDIPESSLQTGQVSCSESYTVNTFKLISRNDNIAVVNGWPIIVQGSNSSDSNNVIILDEPLGQIYDFVFLEVWRKLLGKDDPVYPYGNVLTNPYSDNEIEWDAIGTETTKRVQLQYRIRSVGVKSPIAPSAHGFSYGVYPIGGRTGGEYDYPSYAFRKYGPSDAGLFISGDGSDLSKTDLNTVDGYVYAIPMFMVYRRLKWDSPFTWNTVKHAYTNKQGHIDGYVSDRPDGLLADVVYKEDIVDFRHKILSSGKDVDSVIQQTISKLIAGQLTTVISGTHTGLDSNSSGGSTVMKVEEIVTGCDITSSAFKRRAYCNAEIVHDHNVVQVPFNNGSAWAAGSITISSFMPVPFGSIVSIDGFYSTDGGDLITGVSATNTTITISSSSNLVSPIPTSRPLMMEFTFRYDASSVGYKDVPKEFIEVNKGYTQIATRDRDVPLRYTNRGDLLNYGPNPGVGDPGDTDPRDVLRYEGGNYTENYAFGHDMIIYRTITGGGVIIPLDDGKLKNHYILGVKAVEEISSGLYTSFTVSRSISSLFPYTVDYYSVTGTGLADGTAVRIYLYTGSPNISGYTLGNSFKFFEMSKQGRGVIDTYEIIDVEATRIAATDEYWLDTGDKPIVALCTKASHSGSYIEGSAYAFREDGAMVTIDSPTNSMLPVLNSNEYAVDHMPTKIKLRVTGALAFPADTALRVPVLVHSYVAQSEASSYHFYYKTNVYQGILDSNTEYYGKIRSEGPAIITTLGSGAVRNYSYDVGLVKPTEGRTVNGYPDVQGNTPKWTKYVKPGDYIKFGVKNLYYRILAIPSDTKLTLAERYNDSLDMTSYEIIRYDVPQEGVANVVERMPSYKLIASSTDDMVDYRCYSDDLIVGSLKTGLYLTSPRNRMQDPLNSVPGDFKIGDLWTGARGRNNFILSSASISKLAVDGMLRPHIVYDPIEILNPEHNKKVYQVYLFNKLEDSDLSGRLYLMVVSGEVKSQDELIINGYYSADTVDLFELVGRPIIKYD